MEPTIDNQSYWSSKKNYTTHTVKFYVIRGIWDAEELAYAKIIFDKYGVSYKDKFVLFSTCHSFIFIC